MSDPDAEDVAARTAQPTGGPPPPLQVGGSTTEHKETNAGSSKHKCRRKLREAPKWIEAACALALVGITGYYAYYAHQQAAAAIQAAQAAADNAQIAYWALMSSEETSAFTLGQMEDQTLIQGQSATETKRLVASSERNMRAIQESSQLEQRAWLYIAALKLQSLTVGNPFIVHAWVRNTGKTFAFPMQESAVSLRISFEEVSHLEPQPPAWREPVEGFIPPELPFEVTISSVLKDKGIRIDASHLTAYQNRHLWIYVFGVFRYEDVFSKVRETSFCYCSNGTEEFSLCPKGTFPTYAN
jgi:hypothetical protein